MNATTTKKRGIVIWQKIGENIKDYSSRHYNDNETRECVLIGTRKESDDIFLIIFSKKFSSTPFL